MKKILAVGVLGMILISCGGKSNEVSVHTRIHQYEDSIQQWGGGLGTKEEINAFADDYIETLLEAYEEDPKHANIPTYLHRVNIWYTVKENPEESIKWGKKIIEEYPNYESRELVLETIASTYDLDVKPRDSVQVRKYYEMLLKEFPAISADKKSGIENRLKYNHLPLDEYIMKQTEEIIE